MSGKDLRAVPAALASWLAAVWAVSATELSGFAAALAALLALTAVLIALKARGRLRAVLVGSAVAVGVAALVLTVVSIRHAQRSSAEMMALSAHAVTADVWLNASCRLANHAYHCTGEAALRQPAEAEIEAAQGESVLRGVPVRLRLPEQSISPPQFGERLVVRAIAHRQRPEEVAVFQLQVLEVLAQHPATGVFAVTSELRRGFSAAAATMPELGAELLPGLAIGDTAAVSPELDSWMKQSSLSHLTAVSGANCAVVVAGVTVLLAALGARRWLRIAGSVVALGFFVLLVTPEPSVLRAAVMAVIVLLALALGRGGGGGVSALCVAVVLLLTTDPWLARSFGFVLSVSATAGLLLLAGPLTRRLSRWLPKPVAAALALPLAAQLACQPTLLLLEPSIAVYGVPANLLAAPAAPIATVLGLLGCLLLPVLAPLGQVFLWVAWLPAQWIAGTARLFAQLPGARWEWWPGWWGVLVLVLLTGLILFALFARASTARRVSGALVLLGLGGALVLGFGLTWAADRSRPDNWSFAACDVGQGDALLLRDSGRTAVIDTGEEPRLLADCLRTLGVEHVDLLVLTHWDIDHSGGAASLQGRVGTLLHGPVPGEVEQILLAEFAASGTDTVAAERGDTGMLGTLRWSVLWPKASPTAPPPGNDASVVLEVRPTRAGQGISALLLGDLGEQAQLGLLSAVRSTGRQIAPVQVVKVAHHGSADQSALLYQAAQARVAVFSAGEGNSYGHPRVETIALVHDIGARVARTDQDGLILAGQNESGLWLWSER